ncbi:MAG: ABC transporter ATP-binding protein [Pseudomonadales bacterium]
MIKADHLSRSYGDFVAVNDVSFTIRQSEIVGLLGHNGAGKTTIMKMLTGYLEPSSGRVEIDGVCVEDAPERVQRELGYLPESIPVYPEMSVVDYLEYTAALRGVPSAERADTVRSAIAETDLMEKALDPIATLSRGYQQRVGVAQAILDCPKVLILDEPTNGLDPSQTQHMRVLIKRLAAEATVILSTHIMQEVDAICDRVIILRNGRLVLDEQLDILKASRRLLLTTDASGETLRAALGPVAGLGESSLLEGRKFALEITSGDPATVAAATARALTSNDISIFALHPEQRDLESVFREASELDAEVEVADVA